MNIDLTVLQAFESIRTPALDAFFLLVTQFGEAAILIPALCIIYWCFNKKQAFFLALNFFSALILNHILKITFCIERPWLRWQGEIAPVAKAKITATGYSFPSGHVATATSVYGGIALWYRKNKKIRIAAIVLILAVGLSRIYLGVHTPSDVLASFFAGLILLFLNLRIFNRIAANPEDDKKFLLVSLFVLILGLIYTFYKSHWNPSMEILWLDGIETMGTAAGVLTGWYWEEHRIRFQPIRRVGPAMIVVTVGLAGTFLILSVIGKFLKAIFGILSGNFLCYFLIGFWIIGLYPYLFNKILNPVSDEKYVH